jgi:hydrogenase maturation protease
MSKDEKKLLVLGIGNLIMGDEGVGVQVVQRLEKQKLPENVECLDGGTGSFYLLEPMQQADRILLIDAAASDDEPGTIRLLTPKYAKEYPRTLTAHDIGLKDLLDSFYLMETPPDIRLISITIDPNQSVGMDLSPAIAKAADRAVEMALEEIEAFGNG